MRDFQYPISKNFTQNCAYHAGDIGHIIFYRLVLLCEIAIVLISIGSSSVLLYKQHTVLASVIGLRLQLTAVKIFSLIICLASHG